MELLEFHRPAIDDEGFVLSRICLSRCISSIADLDGEVQAIVKERNELKVKVEWQFSIAQAREKLSRHDEQVQAQN